MKKLPFILLWPLLLGSLGLLSAQAAEVTFKLSVARCGHAFEISSPGTTVTYSGWNFQPPPAPTADGQELLPGTYLEVHFQTTGPLAAGFALHDQTVGELAQIETLDLRETLWNYEDDGPYRPGVTTWPSSSRSFAIPRSRIGHAFALEVEDRSRLCPRSRRSVPAAEF